MIVYNATRKTPVSSRVSEALSFGERLLGLIPRKEMKEDEGLFIPDCSMVHTCFMGFPIDIVFMDAAGKVIFVEKSLHPWRFSKWVRGAASVIEFAGGFCAGRLETGDILELSKGRYIV